MSFSVGREWSHDWPLPAVAVALLLALVALRAVVPAEERGRVRAGIFFIGVAASGLTLATSWGGSTYDWSSPVIIGPIPTGN
jgi:hypothetical protein